MTSWIVKKKIVRMKKIFALKTLYLFISLWSLSGKNLMFIIKLDLCTAVDNFHIVMLFPAPFFRGREDLANRLAGSGLRVKSNFTMAACSLDLDWVETSLVWV